jgi:hypothetical protein
LNKDISSPVFLIIESDNLIGDILLGDIFPGNKMFVGESKRFGRGLKSATGTFGKRDSKLELRTLENFSSNLGNDGKGGNGVDVRGPVDVNVGDPKGFEVSTLMFIGFRGVLELKKLHC